MPGSGQRSGSRPAAQTDRGKYMPAGKTGTSETFIDTNNDGVMDTKTNSLAFVGFAPYDNPEYSIVVLTPNLFAAKALLCILAYI